MGEDLLCSHDTGVQPPQSALGILLKQCSKAYAASFTRVLRLLNAVQNSQFANVFG